MLRKATVVFLFAILVMLPVGVLSAQGPSPTPGGFGNFFDTLATATPTTSSLSNSGSGLAQPTPNPVTQALAKNNW